MYRSHAMWQCWRKCFVVELFAGTTGKDFSVLLFYLYSISLAGSIHRRLPQFFRDHTMSSLFTFSYSPFLELLEAVWVLSVCVSEQFGQKQKTRESRCAVKWGQNVDHSPPSGWQNLEIKGLYMKSIHLTFATFFREDFTRPVASILIWQTHTSLVSPWPPFKDSLPLFLRKHRKMCLMKPLISLQSCLPASHNPGSLFDLETNFCAKIN